MLTDTELAQARGMQLLAMTDKCEIRKPGGTETFDPTTGETTFVPNAPYYPTEGETGWCRVQSVGTSVATEQVTGGQQVTTHATAVAVPWSVDSVEVGHIVKITASRDPRWVGREFPVADVQGSSYATARRLLATDNLG